MSEKILGTLRMRCTRSNGVVEERVVEVVSDVEVDQTVFRSRASISIDQRSTMIEHGQFTVLAMRSLLQEWLDDAFEFVQVNSEVFEVPISLDYALGRLHIGFMSESNWMEVLFKDKSTSAVTFDSGQIAPVW